MSDNTPQNQVETTSVFRADLLKEMESGAATSADSAAGADQLSDGEALLVVCLLYTSPSPRDRQKSRMPSSA